MDASGSGNDLTYYSMHGLSIPLSQFPGEFYPILLSMISVKLYYTIVYFKQK